MSVCSEFRERKIGEVISKGNSSYLHVESRELESRTLTQEEMEEMDLAVREDHLFEITERKVCMECKSEALYDRKSEEWYCQFCNDE